MRAFISELNQSVPPIRVDHLLVRGFRPSPSFTGWCKLLGAVTFVVQVPSPLSIEPYPNAATSRPEIVSSSLEREAYQHFAI